MSNKPKYKVLNYSTVYVQPRVNGLQKLLLYLHTEQIPFLKIYTLDSSWLSAIRITGRLGEWNLRRVWDIVNETDLRIEFTGKHFEVLT